MATVHGPARPHQPLTLEKTTSYSFLTEKHGYGPPLEHSSDPGASREQSTSRRLSGSHGKLHKRTSSASSMQHSPGMPSADATIYTGSALTSPPQPYIHEEDASRFPISPVSSTPKIIKPFARRFSSREENSLDLSRSAYETEGHDLYKSEPVSASRSATDITFPAVGRSKGPSHVRSTSGISQLSTGTSGSAQRHYAHPMRQTPRPYTPPLAMSYGNSAPGSEYSGEGPSQGADEELQMRRLAHDTSRLRGGHPVSSTTSPAPGLRIQTDLSSSRLVHGSQSNLAGTPSSHRFPTDMISPGEPGTPRSRSSLDQALRIRSKEPLDAASRAATIRAARQAFTEKEAAKNQRAEQQELKSAERESRRRERRDAHRRRRSDARQRSRTNSNATSEKVHVVPGQEYASMQPARVSPIHDAEPGIGRPRQTTTAATERTSAKGSWVGFMVWLKTRLLKLGRKMSGRRG